MKVYFIELMRRQVLAQALFERFDFGAGVQVLDHKEWDVVPARTTSNLWEKTVFVEIPGNAPDEPSQSVTFSVDFEEGERGEMICSARAMHDGTARLIGTPVRKRVASVNWLLIRLAMDLEAPEVARSIFAGIADENSPKDRSEDRIAVSRKGAPLSVSKPPALSLDYWAPMKDKPGFQDFVRMKTWREFDRDIKRVLGGFSMEDGHSAGEIAEWVSMESKNSNEEMPRADRPFAVMTRGRSEGYLIEVYGKRHRTAQTEAVHLATIKYLTAPAQVKEVASRLNDALVEGEFSPAILPDSPGNPDAEDSASPGMV